jgi:hypothetical protein
MKTGTFKPDDRAYPGVFISGDDALYRFAPALRTLIEEGSPMPKAVADQAAREMLALLLSCEAK